MDAWQIALGMGVGVGLAAASGFRVFVPLLVVAVAQRMDAPVIAQAGFEWLGSDVALIVLIAATVAEVGGYYVPWIDNLLDTVATPAAGVAGTLMMMGMLEGAPEPIRWGVGIVGGGGTSLAVQGLTVLTRGASTIATAGLGNPIVSTTENVGSTIFSILAVVIGPLVIVAVVVGLWLLVRKLVSLRKRAAEKKHEVASLAGAGADEDPADFQGPLTRRRMSPLLRSKGVVGLRPKREA